MSSNQAELEATERLASEEDSVTPPGEAVLAELGIESTAVKSIKPRWKRTQYRAIINWLTKYKPPLNVSNLGKVKGLLETFNHLCEVEAWEEARKVILIFINTPNPEKLHNQLRYWGYYSEQSELYKRILGRLDPNFDALLLNNLGITCTVLGNQIQAINYYQQSLALARKVEDRQGEIDALGSLGTAYYFLSDYNQAIEYYQQSLDIAQDTGDRQAEGKSLSNLASAYFSLSKYTQAIDYYQQRLVLARKIEDRYGEGAALGNLGSTYLMLGDYTQALEYYQQSLAIAREIQDCRWEAQVLGNLGNVYFYQGNYAQAIEYHQKDLEIAREIGDRYGESNSLGNLGSIYLVLRDYNQAIEYHQQGSDMEVVVRLKSLLILHCNHE